MKCQDFSHLIFNCPSCLAKTQFQIAWNSSGTKLFSISGYVTRYVLKCTACGEYIFLQTRKVDSPLPSESTVERQFPPSGLHPHKSIPPDIAVDLQEAALCLSIGAWNAATAMCRRSLQTCAKDKGANPKDDLIEQLKELKNNGLIQDTIYAMAEAIRKKGNIGAHPGRDPIINTSVSEKEARAVFSIVEHVFKYIYELPSEVAALTGP